MHAVNELTRNSPLLKGGQKAAQLSGAEDACQFDSGRDAPSACKFFILDVSEIAKELGLPTCNEVSHFSCMLSAAQIGPAQMRLHCVRAPAGFCSGLLAASG